MSKRTGNNLNLIIKGVKGKSADAQIAEMAIGPVASAAVTSFFFQHPHNPELDMTEVYVATEAVLAKTQAGNLAEQRKMLTGQAIALNSIFAEMARRASVNMREYPHATEIYMRMALKAQAQSRATIEALDRMVNGREQTVKHVHLDNRGGQAVIAETVHTGGAQNGIVADQCHTAIATSGDTALSSPNPIRQTVPVASGEREAALPNARRHKPRRTKGQSKCVEARP